MAGTSSAFTGGDDFVAFDASPPPPAQAGPSRLPQPPLTSATPNGKGKGRAFDSEDERLLAAQNGRRDGADGEKKKSKKERKLERERERAAAAKKGSKGAGGVKDETGPRNLKEERKAKERHAPWLDLVDLDGCHDPSEMLNEEILAFYRYVSPTRQEYETRLFIIELITRAIHKAWPDAEVSPFGSWQTQLYLPQGDIDLVVSNKRFTESNKAKLLAELARAMRMAYITDTVAIISKARVPIIKFVTTEGKLNVDISLNQTNGISAGAIINQYLAVLPGARQLILVVKAFLSQRSMNEVYTGGLGSYAVICLVISFLQIHPKLRRSEMDPLANLGTLLIEFFELYGRNFNLDEVGISIRRGGFYFAKRSRGWYRAGQPFLLCIEDPQDKDNDISSGSFGIRQVRATLSGAYELLQAKVFDRAEKMAGKRSGRYKEDRGDSDEWSMLSGIMGITKETLKHRQELSRLHGEGRLQRMLGIPPKADPLEYLSHQDHPPHISDDHHPRFGGTGKKRDLPEEGRGGASRGKKRKGEVRAIEVEDEEVIGLDEDSSEGDDGVDEVDGSDEEFEVVEVNGTKPAAEREKMRDRFGSVSEDEEAYDNEPIVISDDEGDSDVDTRYGIASGNSRVNGSGRAEGKSGRAGTDSDSSEEGSVVAMPAPSRDAGGGGKKRKKMGARERREFWAKKGKTIDGEEAEDDVEEGEISS